jgi:hypothetical protein
MRIINRHVSPALVLAGLVTASVLAQTFTEDFSALPAGSCYADGTEAGAWRFVYDGYGCSGVVSTDGNEMLFGKPAAATAAGETHGTLVVGPSSVGDFSLTLSTTTARQLRTGSAPNPWEVSWVLWHFTDNAHFYYFVAKPNGWELGKEDPAYPGGQRFLATGSSPAFPIGSWYRITVSQAGQTIRVFVNDLLIVSVDDRERPYTSGRIGLYSEDAEVYFDNVSLTTPDKPGKGRKKGLSQEGVIGH